MSSVPAESTTQLSQNSEQKHHEQKLWSLLLRAIPLILSLLLFVLVASADINKWSSRTLQAMLATATLFGIVGLVFFIPKKANLE